jgi:hypothetical protein
MSWESEFLANLESINTALGGSPIVLPEPRSFQADSLLMLSAIALAAAGGGGGGSISTAVRQTVMSGPTVWLAAGTGRQVVSQNDAAIATIADGFSVAAGAVDERFEIPNATSWDSLTASDTCYLYVEWDGSTGHSILEPAYGATAPSSPASGQWWFNTDTYVGQSWNGSAWVAAPRLYVGEAITDGSSVTDIVQYAFNGKAEIGGTVAASNIYNYNHNLGTSRVRVYGYFNNISGTNNPTNMANGSGGYPIGIGLYSSAWYYSTLRLNDPLSVRLRTGNLGLYYGADNGWLFTGATAQIFVERNF